MSHGTGRYLGFYLGVLELGHTIPWSDLNASVELVSMEKWAFCYILMDGPGWSIFTVF